MLPLITLLITVLRIRLPAATPRSLPTDGIWYLQAGVGRERDEAAMVRGNE